MLLILASIHFSILLLYRRLLLYYCESERIFVLFSWHLRLPGWWHYWLIGLFWICKKWGCGKEYFLSTKFESIVLILLGSLSIHPELRNFICIPRIDQILRFSLFYFQAHLSFHHIGRIFLITFLLIAFSKPTSRLQFFKI